MNTPISGVLECRNTVRARARHLREKRDFLRQHNFNIESIAVSNTVDELEKVQFSLERVLDQEGIEYNYGLPEADPEHTSP